MLSPMPGAEDLVMIDRLYFIMVATAIPALPHALLEPCHLPETWPVTPSASSESGQT